MFESSQSVYVSVAHRYWNPRWSESRNREAYGRDASAQGVGSNLKLRLSCTGPVEVDLQPWMQFLKNLCDHRCLFTDFLELSEGPSTLEAVSLFLGKRVFAQSTPTGARWSSLTVFEGEKLGCTVWPDCSEVEIWERVINLELVTQASPDPDSLLAAPRGQAWAAVRDAAPEFRGPADTGVEAWATRLFEVLADKVKGLRKVEIDLGSHGRWRVSAPT